MVGPRLLCKEPQEPTGQKLMSEVTSKSGSTQPFRAISPAAQAMGGAREPLTVAPGGMNHPSVASGINRLWNVTRIQPGLGQERVRLPLYGLRGQN